MTKQRYITLSALNRDGSTRSTQLWSDDAFEALNLLQDWANEAQIVVAVIYDSSSGESFRYVVDGQSVVPHGFNQVMAS